jgi:hypothetical protein
VSRFYGVPRKNKGYPFFVAWTNGACGMRMDIEAPKTDEQKQRVEALFAALHAALDAYTSERPNGGAS